MSNTGNPFNDPAFCRAYDHYVTVERPAAWNEGYRDGYDGLAHHKTGRDDPEAYDRGYNVGLGEKIRDDLGYDPGSLQGAQA